MATGGTIPNHALHNKMIRCCKNIMGTNTLIDKQLRCVPNKDKKLGIPDLKLQGISIECQTIPDRSLSKLRLYRRSADYLILCLPTHSSIDEIWLYDVDKDSITQNFVTNKHTGVIAQIKLFSDITKPKRSAEDAK